MNLLRKGCLCLLFFPSLAMASDMGGLMVVYISPFSLTLWLLAMNVKIDKQHKWSLQLILLYFAFAIALNIYIFMITSDSEGRLIQSAVTFSFVIPILRWCFKPIKENIEPILSITLTIDPKKLQTPDTNLSHLIPQRLINVSNGMLRHNGGNYDREDNMILFLSVEKGAKLDINNLLARVLDDLNIEQSAVTLKFKE